MPTMPAGTFQPASLSLLDAGGELGSMHLWGKIITAANHDAQETAWQAVVTAALALALGTKKRAVYADEQLFAAARPTNGAAREVSLQTIMQDTVSGEMWRFNLPTVNIALIEYVDNIGAKDAVDPTTTEVAAFSTALAAFSVNPLHPTNAVAVRGFKVIRGQK